MFVCMCMCSSVYSSVDLSLYTQSTCFIPSHETRAREETQFWEVQMKKTEEKEEAADTESSKGVWRRSDGPFNFCNTAQRRWTKKKRKRTLRLAVTPIPSSTGWGAARLLNLHNSKGQSMEEGPFVRNCQRRQGPQAWSPLCQKCLFGVPLGHDRAPRTGARG